MRQMNSLLVTVIVIAAMAAAPCLVFAVVDDADNLIVSNGETYTLGGAHSYNVGILIEGSGVLYVAPYDGSADTGWLELHAPSIRVVGGGTINGDYCGYRTAEGPGSGNYPGSGGSYGGQGGSSGWGTAAKPPYGESFGPFIEMGSGGASQTGGVGGAGGASISLYATVLYVVGTITVDGDQGTDYSGWGDGGGGGSGGGILISGATTTVDGTLSARGGRGGNAADQARRGGGGGGGGRIKVFYHCSYLLLGVYSVAGGIAGTGGAGDGGPGQPGTYYTESYPNPIITSIIDVGNDQGRQVRLSWLKACDDSDSVPTPVVTYSIWRRIDDLPSRTIGSPDLPVRPNYPDGDWEFVLEVPARGEIDYNVIAPTLADSTAAGMHMSTFFVSGVTADPHAYWDSEPASGYSVDNLAPSAPANLILAGGVLDWDDPVDADFDYFTVYGSSTPNLGSASLLGYTTGTSLDVSGSGYAYLLVTATDFSGNEGEAAVADGATGVESTPGMFRLLGAAPNPFNPQTTIRFEVPGERMVNLRIYDVSGRVVRELLRGERVLTGRHSAEWDGRDGTGRTVAAGVYFYHLSAGAETDMGRMVLVK